MALVLKDRVKETSVTTGTGAIALDGATGAYQTFSTIGNGNTTYYCIAGQTTNEWEVGIGTYTTSTDTLSRDTILASSNSNTIVTFSAGTKDVFITYPSEKAIYEEPDGDTLINAGPITILGPGVSNSPPPTPYISTLGRFYGNDDTFQQIYVQNQYNGVDASTDLVAYNDLGDGTNYFIDMGMASSSYSSASYPIFSENCAYLYNSGLTTGTGAAGETSELLIGTGTVNSDLVLFTGGIDTVNEAVRVSGADQSIEIQKGVTINETLDVTGAATFGSTVLLDADPTLNLQAATKQYVDTAVSTGLHLHQPVLVATTGNLTASYSNGTAGVGATLTNSGTQVALAIDGINMATTNRVLVWQQSSSVQNGVYDVTSVGSGSTNWVLTRSSDANTYAPQSDTGLGGGDYFFVQSGTLGAGDSYVCTNDGVIVFGTTPITFAQFSGAITYVGGTNIDITGQTISLTGTVAATNGGTGTATVTTGNLLYGSGTNAWSKLGLGSAYQSLVVNGSGTQVEWNAVNLSSSNAVTGSLGATFGGTGLTSYALGDTLYSSASNTLAKLSGNTSTTKQYLSQTGTGSASAAPSWATIDASDIGAGTLPAVRGGTGQSSYAVGDLLYADTTTSLAKLAGAAVGNVLISGGISAAPSYGKVALASAVSGTLPVANGGTGVTTSTGTGAVVLGTAPTITLAVFQAYTEKVETIGTIATSTYNIDLSLANIFDLTLGTNVTVTFTNPPAAGTTRPVTLIVRQPAASPGKLLTVTGAQYTDGTAPILSTGANQKDVLSYWSIDGGTTYFGTFAMANVS
jgi:hypothetical protein